MISRKPMLLISGPSGGGKSTLIRQLVDKTLAPEILSRLPEGCGHWPMIEANDLLKGDLSADALPDDAPGLLVHYDMVFIRRYRIDRYEDDPALGLLAAADPLHVVFVKPDIDVLRRQFLDRQTRHQLKKSMASRLWSRCFRLPMRRALAPFTGKPTLSTEELYREHKWLAACYDQWELFVGNAVANHSNSRLTVIQPASGNDSHPQFQLVATPSASHLHD